jgi:hypothetical protein
MGYGIPDMEKASFFLMNLSSPIREVSNQWTAYPNPLGETLYLNKNGNRFADKIEIEIYSIDGKLLRRWIKPDVQQTELRDIQLLPNGILLLKINSANSTETIKLIKVQ